ncbi:MAG: 30S ribosomal protein S16 [Candidatus Glassbacteria bacterium]
MSVKIRLRRMGKKKSPCYRLAVVDSRVKRDGRFIEFVGFYDPMTSPHTVRLKEDRIFEWLGNGASCSATVGSLLKQAGLLERWHQIRGKKEVEEEAGARAAARKPAEEKTGQAES